MSYKINILILILIQCLKIAFICPVGLYIYCLDTITLLAFKPLNYLR